MSSRRRAWEILESIESGRKWVPERSADRDDAFVRTLVQGVLRWQLTLDYLIGRISGRDVSRIDSPTLRILRIGFYQLHWMRVPDHAAVNESVELAKRVAPRGRNFVNAILRKAGRQNLSDLIPSGDDLSSVSVRTSHPAWLMRRWEQTFGPERARSIAVANQEASHPDLFVDTRHVSVGVVQEWLEREGIESEVSSVAPDMLRVLGSTAILSELVDRGHVWPMDEGSAVVATLAGTGRNVLDLAAAPGGKTLVMLRRGNRVVSHDVSLERLQPLARLRKHEPRISIVAGDAVRAPFRRRFDVVVLDAPCSATGVIRKHPEIKWRLSEDLIKRSASLQRKLVRQALDLTGERFVYATCSLEREENDEVIREAISERDDFAPGDVRDIVTSSLHRFVSRGVLRLTPDSGTDGFTAITLVRRDPDHS